MNIFKKEKKENNRLISIRLDVDEIPIDVVLDCNWVNHDYGCAPGDMEKRLPIELHLELPCFGHAVYDSMLFYQDTKNEQGGYINWTNCDFNEVMQEISKWIETLKKEHPREFGVVSKKLVENYNGKCFAKISKDCNYVDVIKVVVEDEYVSFSGATYYEDFVREGTSVGGDTFHYGDKSDKFFEQLNRIENDTYLPISEEDYNCVINLIDKCFYRFDSEEEQNVILSKLLKKLEELPKGSFSFGTYKETITKD